MLGKIGFWFWRLWIAFATFVIIPLAVGSQWAGDGIPPWICYWIYAGFITCVMIVMLLSWFREELPHWRNRDTELPGWFPIWCRDCLRFHKNRNLL
jgi:hypothetical protein